MVARAVGMVARAARAEVGEALCPVGRAAAAAAAQTAAGTVAAGCTPTRE